MSIGNDLIVVDVATHHPRYAGDLDQLDSLGNVRIFDIKICSAAAFIAALQEGQRVASVPIR